MDSVTAANGSRTIEDRVKEVICENLGVAVEDIKPESKIVDDLGADSLDTVELLMSLEDEFEMEIPDEDAENWTTVSDVLKYFSEKAPK